MGFIDFSCFISAKFHEEKNQNPNLPNHELFKIIIGKWKNLSKEEKIPFEFKSSESFLKYYQEKLAESE
jgi:hypothetical protein